MVIRRAWWSRARCPLAVGRLTPASWASSVAVSAGPAINAINMLAPAGLPISAAMIEISGPSFIVRFSPNYFGSSTGHNGVSIGLSGMQRKKSMTLKTDEIDAPATHAGEASPRYQGWRVVIVCTVMALFCWGFGFY